MGRLHKDDAKVYGGAMAQVIKVVGVAASPPDLDAGAIPSLVAGRARSVREEAADLKKYRVCLVTGSTSHEGREPWDGIAELWFENRAALEAAWSSEGGKTALAHSPESHNDRLVLYFGALRVLVG